MRRQHSGTYNFLCEQQFGEGAEFDGEMCACKKGYVVRGGSCRRASAAAGALEEVVKKRGKKDSGKCPKKGNKKGAKKGGKRGKKGLDVTSGLPYGAREELKLA